MRQYLHFCTSKTSTFVLVSIPWSEKFDEIHRRLQRQNLYFCTSKASKLSTSSLGFHFVLANMPLPLQAHALRRQYLYFCTSKASKVSTCPASRLDPRTRARGPVPQLRQYLYFCTSCVSICTFVQVNESSRGPVPQLRQYLYFRTSKASQVSWHRYSLYLLY